ncbi:MAG: helix-turn-helix transcriptional regulator, partial [Acidimicrobiales bacterium]
IERGALGALAKLDRLLPARLRAQLVSLRASTVSLSSPTEAVPTENLVRLAQACDSCQRATFAYTDGDGRHSDRRVEPYRLVATDRRWYLVAFDLDRQDWRTFRVDRAADVVVTGHSFTPRPIDDPAAMVAEAISTTGYTHRAVISVAAPVGEVAQLIPPSTGTVTARGTESTVALGVDDFDWLAGYLVGLGVDFEVLEPPELRHHLAAVGRRLHKTHARRAAAR